MSDDDGYLTTDEVCAKLQAAGADPKTVSRVFAARLQPQNLDDPDHKYALGVPVGDQAYLVIYRFGPGRPLVAKSPLDESGPDWRPRWLSVEGPFPAATPEDLQRINKKSGELTNG